MIPGFGFIQGVIQIRKIIEEDKKRKAAIEAEELVRMRRGKSWGAKTNNLYAEMLSKSKPAKDKTAEIIIEQESLFTKHLDNAILDACIKEHGTKADKEYCMVTESVSRKEMEAMYPELDEHDITITKAQGELVSELIDFYIDNDRTCSLINEDNLISLMSKLNVSGL